jgi:hypothetical protein
MLCWVLQGSQPPIEAIYSHAPSFIALRQLADDRRYLCAILWQTAAREAKNLIFPKAGFL